MATTTSTVQTSTWSSDKLFLSAKGEEVAQWHQDLIDNGFAVVKGAVPKDRADAYANSMFEWLEGL